MKNYLKCSLTDDEKSEIIGIIWMVVRNFKYRLNKRNNNTVELIEDLDLTYSDKYDFEHIQFEDYRENLCPLTESQKTNIVNKLNTLMDDLSLFELKRALTFNEKLVFFFVFMEKYKAVDTQKLLNVSKKTIYNWQESVKDKINLIREVF